MKFLVDTCVLSELVKKVPDRNVVTWVNDQDENDLAISVLTLGELEKGISKLDTSKRKQILERWLNEELVPRFENRILEIDEQAGLLWGQICGAAEREGGALPAIDSLLAASAMAHRLTFVTRDSAAIARCGVRCLNPWEG
ncbi:MAG: type II toxin-antitoxin system VapC family toxin [Deltaproteobacteria bacterium]|nr:type II toxin-antitoxin system VapC family toxin [Deltaproteobacteria bacterium]MBI3294868.1 type II toxin-antitoxin system VapC family toxin [Deltaproteobacteria bacterium]